MTANPMNPVERMQKAPRCKARSKRTKERCRAPAVKGWAVCRMHGARGGAPKGERNGAYRHGGYTQEAVAASQYVRALVRLLKPTLDEIG